MPPRISKHFANRAKYYFLFYGCGNQLWERLNFLPRDTEETVAEPRWEPTSPELQRCVLVTHCTKAQQGSLLVAGSQPSIVRETSGGGIWNRCRCSFAPGSLSRSVGGCAEQGRIRPGKDACVLLGWDGQLWLWVAVEGEWLLVTADSGKNSEPRIQPALTQAPLRSKNNYRLTTLNPARLE